LTHLHQAHYQPESLILLVSPSLRQSAELARTTDQLEALRHLAAATILVDRLVVRKLLNDALDHYNAIMAYLAALEWAEEDVEHDLA
jgi:hypothetical protein